MANENNAQDTQAVTAVSESPSLLLSENDMDSVAAGDGGPETMPLCGIKPNRRAMTQKLVDDVLAHGGTVNSVDYETGKMNFTLGPGVPAPEIPRD